MSPTILAGAERTRVPGLWIPATLDRFTPHDWLVDVVVEWRGRLYTKTVGTRPWLTEEEALRRVRASLEGGRNELRPPGDRRRVVEMVARRRHEHPTNAVGPRVPPERG